jgi:hypothetical protein
MVSPARVGRDGILKSIIPILGTQRATSPSAPPHHAQHQLLSLATLPIWIGSGPPYMQSNRANQENLSRTEKLLKNLVLCALPLHARISTAYLSSMARSDPTQSSPTNKRQSFYSIVEHLLNAAYHLHARCYKALLLQ